MSLFIQHPFLVLRPRCDPPAHPTPSNVLYEPVDWPQPSRDDWCKNCPPEIAEQVSSPGGLLAGIFLHLLELLEEECSDLNVQRQDSTPSFFL